MGFFSRRTLGKKWEWQNRRNAEAELRKVCYAKAEEILQAMKGYREVGDCEFVEEGIRRGLKYKGMCFFNSSFSVVAGFAGLEAFAEALLGGLLESIRSEVAEYERNNKETAKRLTQLTAQLTETGGRRTLLIPAEVDA